MCLVSEVTIRPACAVDVVRIAEIIHGEPSPETVGLVGDRRLASAFGKGLVELDHIANSAKPTVVAEIDGPDDEARRLGHRRIARAMDGQLAASRRAPTAAGP
jgi:hypothetical protein